jgi:hypothetical protein
MRYYVITCVLVGLAVNVYANDQSHQRMERIACHPDQKSPFSKEDCLAHNCLFDDAALPNEIQCYTAKINSMIRRRIQMHKTKGSGSTKQNQGIMTVEIPDIVKTDPKYRIDCAPDIDEYRSFCDFNLSKNRTLNTTNQLCTTRGCVWDPNAEQGISTCYIPLEKGGYSVVGEPNQLSNAITQYTLTRRIDSTNRFSLFNDDIVNLNVQVSVSGPEMIRMTIRDANAQRYEVPVPIQWTPSTPSPYPSKIKFQMTTNANGQVGFRVQRTDKPSILFDTSFFANGFIYDDKFLQIITTIPSRNVYGKLFWRFFDRYVVCFYFAQVSVKILIQAFDII